MRKGNKNIFSLNMEEIYDEAKSIASFRKFYAASIFSWIHGRLLFDVDKFSDLPKDFRALLKQRFDIEKPLHLESSSISLDGSVKLLFRTHDNMPVESVFIPFAKRASVCLSTQIGCKFACKFCYSGKFGFKRNLSVEEMLFQLYLTEVLQGRKITHVVFMGSGEPLDNLENLLKTVEILNNPRGRAISLRRMTVSTVGIIPAIDIIAGKLPQINLAISLHNPIDEERRSIMPVAKLYPLKDLLKTLRAYQKNTRRQITFEYVVLPGENNMPRHVRAIKSISKQLDCVFNLIPKSQIGLNPAKQRVIARQFLWDLKREGISKVTLRNSRGSDVMAACGQLLVGQKL